MPPLCGMCKEKPRLPIPVASVFDRNDPPFILCQKMKQFPLAMGSFLWLQWERLGWSLPDQILPLSGMLPIAQGFGDLMQRPVLPALHSSIKDIEMIEEEATLLILAKMLDTEEIQEVVRDLMETFPKKMYALTFL